MESDFLVIVRGKKRVTMKYEMSLRSTVNDISMSIDSVSGMVILLLLLHLLLKLLLSLFFSDSFVMWSKSFMNGFFGISANV